MIRLSLPCVPPSLNHAYPHHGNTRFPSKELTRFKTEMRMHIAREYLRELSFFTQNKPYGLYIIFTFLEIQNKGWGTSRKNKDGTKVEVPRYKKMDVTNRLKILEDMLSQATGIDDSHNQSVTAVKRLGDTEKTDIFIWDCEKEVFPTCLPPGTLNP